MQPNKEWKPKLSRKSGVNGLEPDVEPGKSAAPADRSDCMEEASPKLQDKISRVNISENVIIAPHLRVSESDKYRLTFGSLDTDFQSPNASSEEQHIEHSERFVFFLFRFWCWFLLACEGGKLSLCNSLGSQENAA